MLKAVVDLVVLSLAKSRVKRPRNQRYGLFLLGAWMMACTSVWAFQNNAPTTNLPALPIAQMPAEAKTTYALIAQGGPFPYDKDGSVFGNREKILPQHRRGYYREYTVRTPGVRTRGARRIVCGGKPRVPDACYYTSDHYASFHRITE
jgi:ribonuclease T1